MDLTKKKTETKNEKTTENQTKTNNQENSNKAPQTQYIYVRCNSNYLIRRFQSLVKDTDEKKETVANKSAESQSLKNQSVKKQSVEKQSVEKQSLNNELVNNESFNKTLPVLTKLSSFVQEKPNMIQHTNKLFILLSAYVHHLLLLIEAGFPYDLNCGDRYNSIVNKLTTYAEVQNMMLNSESTVSVDKEKENSSSESKIKEIRCKDCLRSFQLYEIGKINDTEKCVFHTKMLINSGKGYKIWECCHERIKSFGCYKKAKHTWIEIDDIKTNNYSHFKKTRPSMVKKDNYGIYGLDCGLVDTTKGKELSNVALLDIKGKIVYFSWVKTKGKLLSDVYYSKETFHNVTNAKKDFKTVQEELLGFISSETIIIGHGLDNDLKALQLIHYTCIDTSILFLHKYDLPNRYKIQDLTLYFLNRKIQNGSHCSYEDANAAIDMLLYRVYHDGFDGNKIKKYITKKDESKKNPKK